MLKDLNFLGLEEEEVQILQQDGPPPYQSNTVHSYRTQNYSSVSLQLDVVHCPIKMNS
jgi:hypothetical protein